jgi:hypothetical protein
MIKNEPYYYDETTTTVDSEDWIETKYIDINRDPFNYNFIKLIFDIGLKCPAGEKGEAAIFIDEEEKPRLTIQFDLPFLDIVHREIDTYNVSWGNHKIILCLKGKITNKQLKISVLRIYTLPEIVGQLTPILVLQGIL